MARTKRPRGETRYLESRAAHDAACNTQRVAIVRCYLAMLKPGCETSEMLGYAMEIEQRKRVREAMRYARGTYKLVVQGEDNPPLLAQLAEEEAAKAALERQPTLLTEETEELRRAEAERQTPDGYAQMENNID